jgi:hypothetical protein
MHQNGALALSPPGPIKQGSFQHARIASKSSLNSPNMSAYPVPEPEILLPLLGTSSALII